MKTLADIKKEFNFDRTKCKILSIEQRTKIKSYYKKCWDFEKTAKHFNIPKGTIYYCVRKVLGLERDKEVKYYQNQLNQLSDFQMGYVVGIIEGEGYLGIIRTKKRFRAVITISNRDKKMITYLDEIIGIPFSIHNFRKKKEISTHKERKNFGIIYEFKTNDKRLLFPLLQKIYPYMISKKKEVKILLEFLKEKDMEKQRRLYCRLQMIKAKKNNKVRIKLKKEVGDEK